jgi:multicomponent Na+:H+ antiporter subunit G
MSEIFHLLGDFFLIVGTLFFIVGTVGIIRFFDLYTRLHALSKVDNIGLGFIVLGLIFQSQSFFSALKMLLIWIVVLLSSATLSYILSSHSNAAGEKPHLRQDNEHN